MLATRVQRPPRAACVAGGLSTPDRPCPRRPQNYTKPKKIAHKHKKYPLATLKFYRVDDDGKITRLRRECPHENCGAGVFMATHFDRHYCGKCGLTYKHEK